METTETKPFEIKQLKDILEENNLASVQAIETPLLQDVVKNYEQLQNNYVELDEQFKQLQKRSGLKPTGKQHICTWEINATGKGWYCIDIECKNNKPEPIW